MEERDPGDDAARSGTSPDSYRLVTEGGPPPSENYGIIRGSGGLIFVYFGVFILIAGISALAMASFEASSVATFNNACAQNPLCTPEPDYSGSITAVGAVLLLLALGLFGLAYRAYQKG